MCPAFLLPCFSPWSAAGRPMRTGRDRYFLDRNDSRSSLSPPRLNRYRAPVLYRHRRLPSVPLPKEDQPETLRGQALALSRAAAEIFRGVKPRAPVPFREVARDVHVQLYQTTWFQQFPRWQVNGRVLPLTVARTGPRTRTR